MPNCKTANAVKLTTNVFREINIGFINELALLFEKLGIDMTKITSVLTIKGSNGVDIGLGNVRLESDIDAKPGCDGN